MENRNQNFLVFVSNHFYYTFFFSIADIIFFDIIFIELIPLLGLSYNFMRIGAVSQWKKGIDINYFGNWRSFKLASVIIIESLVWTMTVSII
jgi:hypothetical protein